MWGHACSGARDPRQTCEETTMCGTKPCVGFLWVAARRQTRLVTYEDHLLHCTYRLKECYDRRRRAPNIPKIFIHFLIWVEPRWGLPAFKSVVFVRVHAWNVRQKSTHRCVGASLDSLRDASLSVSRKSGQKRNDRSAEVRLQVEHM